MRSRSPGRRCRLRGERGAVTAEFATAMPAVILVLAFCLAGGQLANQQLRLQDAASTAARAASRGEPASTVDARARHLVPRASVNRSDRNGLVCVTVALPAALPGLASAVTLTASACALAETR
ncbi:TadE family type IV pilus minor pilin [Homoserinimonas sp. A520]